MIMQNYVGCDISKQWLDFFDEASGRYHRLDNNADAIAAYVSGLDPSRDFVVMEATGVHDRLLRHALARAGVPFSRHNPAHTHHYAKSTRRRAKTDRLDARMLSDYGRRYRPEAEPARMKKSSSFNRLPVTATIWSICGQCSRSTSLRPSTRLSLPICKRRSTTSTRASKRSRAGLPTPFVKTRTSLAT